MYLLGLPFGYCITYLILFFGIPLFFDTKIPRLRYRSLLSIAIILLVYFTVLKATFLIPDVELANRVLHVLGGGVLIVIVCFLSIKDSGVTINMFQFFVIGILIATMCGVINEIAEFILQSQFGFIAAHSVIDTWLDLTSNTIGAVVASACIAPLMRKLKRTLL